MTGRGTLGRVAAMARQQVAQVEAQRPALFSPNDHIEIISQPSLVDQVADAVVDRLLTIGAGAPVTREGLN